jgi:hypothetical protein
MQSHITNAITYYKCDLDDCPQRNECARWLNRHIGNEFLNARGGDYLDGDCFFYWEHTKKS